MNNKVANTEQAQKQFCNAWKGGLGSVLSLVQPLNSANIVGSYDYPSKCNKESLPSS